MKKEECLETYKVIASKKVRIPFYLYYHAFIYNNDNLKSILINGLKCPLLTKSFDAIYGFNGLFYISLVKYPFFLEGTNFSDYSAFDIFYQYHPMIMLNDIEPVYCKKALKANLLANTPLPFRQSCYVDEYQQFWKINPDKIYGITYPVFNLIERGQDDVYESLRNMILLIDELDLDLNIYDVSNVKNGDVRVIDKAKVKSLKL